MSHNPQLRWRALAAAILLAIAGGCELPNPEIRDLRPYPEDRGTFLAHADPDSGAAWSMDGAEVYFVGPSDRAPTFALQAVRVADGAVRPLDPGVQACTGKLVRSADGAALYYRAVADPAAPCVLRDAVAGRDFPGVSLTPVSASADGRRVLLARDGVPSDPLRVLDVGAGTVTELPCRGFTELRTGLTDALPPYKQVGLRVVGLSPVLAADGAAAACLADVDGEERLVRVDVATGAATPLPSLADRLAVRLGDAGAEQLGLAGLTGLDRIDAAGQRSAAYRTGEHALLGVLDRYDHTTGYLTFPAPRFSRDGRALAFWQSDCVRALVDAEGQLLTCELAVAQLEVADLATLEVHLVAESEEPGTTAAFSDDATGLAYLFGGDLYARVVPAG